MSATLNCKDGTVVKISDETEKELRAQFGPKKFEPIEICCLEVGVPEGFCGDIFLKTTHSGQNISGHKCQEKRVVDRFHFSTARELINALEKAIEFSATKRK